MQVWPEVSEYFRRGNIFRTQRQSIFTQDKALVWASTVNTNKPEAVESQKAAETATYSPGAHDRYPHDLTCTSKLDNSVRLH